MFHFDQYINILSQLVHNSPYSSDLAYVGGLLDTVGVNSSPLVAYFNHQIDHEIPYDESAESKEHILQQYYYNIISF